MFREERCVEYFFDSRNYNEQQILESIKKEEVGFEKKKSEININLNEYGIYEVKLKFFDNKIFIFKNKMTNNTKIENKKKPKVRKTYRGYETYCGDNKIYGQYKTTRTYQPI